MKSDLTVIAVAHNDNGFTENMIKSVHKFTHPTPNIIICDNGKNSVFPDIWKQYPNVKVIKNKRAHKYKKNKAFFNTSMQHGLGLNMIFKHVATKRTAIIEPDCAVLKEGWDTIGDGYEMKACVKGVGFHGEHYYYPCFMIFETDCMYRGGKKIDFRPEYRKHKRGIIISSKAGKIKRYSDVGWTICTKIHHDKVNFIDSVKWDKKQAMIFNKGFSHKTNVFIDRQGDVIGSHFWRGSELARRGQHAAVHKNMWIKTVQSVVDGYA